MLEQLGVETSELGPIIGKMDDRLQRRRAKKKRIVEIREVSAEEIEEARPTPEEEDARIQAELEELIELQKGLPPEPQAEEYVPEVWDETAAMVGQDPEDAGDGPLRKTGGARRAGHADPAAGPRLHVATSKRRRPTHGISSTSRNSGPRRP